MGINSCNFDGYLGRDAELRTVGDTPLCVFSICATKGYGDKKKEFWVRCNLWGRYGEVMAPYLLKGQYVSVQGEMFVSEWEKDGQPRWSIEMDCRQVSSPKQGKATQNETVQMAQDVFNPSVPQMGDDVPF
jgi:single stranded DNA-binding protein